MESGSGSAAIPGSDPEAAEPSSSGMVTTAGTVTTASREEARSSSASAVASGSTGPPSRYEAQKRRDWNTFLQYLKSHKPPLTLSTCSGAHVIEFLKNLDQFGKTKVHISECPYFGQPNPPAPCTCPLKQAWGSLDALIGRLRAAYDENGGQSESNPFGARSVRMYMREVREGQAKARGIHYEKKRKRTSTDHSTAAASVGEADGSAGMTSATGEAS